MRHPAYVRLVRNILISLNSFIATVDDWYQHKHAYAYLFVGGGFGLRNIIDSEGYDAGGSKLEIKVLSRKKGHHGCHCKYAFRDLAIMASEMMGRKCLQFYTYDASLSLQTRQQGRGNERIGAGDLYILGQSHPRTIPTGNIGTIGQTKGVGLLSLLPRVVPPIHRHACLP